MKLPGFLTLTMLLFLLPHSVIANFSDSNKEIRGKVVEEGVDTPVEYVTISLFNVKDSTLVTGTISDEKGAFTLSKIKYGRYYLVLSFIGFDDKIIPEIKVSKDNPSLDLGVISLSSSSTTLEEISVSAKKSAVSSNIDKQVVNVGSNLTAKGGTAADALKTAPSVTVDHEGNVKVRGSSDFTVLINGKPTALSSAEVLKQTPADIIEKIEVITGYNGDLVPEKSLLTVPLKTELIVPLCILRTG